MRLTDDEFFRLTPHQFHLLLDRFKEKREREELLYGIVASTVANHSFAPPKKPLTPGDYMPSQWAVREERKVKAKPKRRTRQTIANNVRGFLMARFEQQGKPCQTTSI